MDRAIAVIEVSNLKITLVPVSGSFFFPLPQQACLYGIDLQDAVHVLKIYNWNIFNP